MPVQNRISRKDLLGLASVVGWLLLVFVGYYLYHKPVALEQINGIAAPVLDFLLAVGVTAFCGGLGKRIYSAARLSELEAAVLQASLGLGLMGLMWLFLGVVIGYSSWLGYGIFLALGISNYRAVSAWIGGLKNGLKSLGAVDGFHRFLLLGSAALALIQLPYAVVPPTKWDSLMYHLDMPRRYLEIGRFEFLENHFVWGHPQLTEMLYTWMISLRGLETATALAWVFGCLGILGLFGFVSRNISQEAGILAVTALLTGAAFRGEMSWGYVDGMAFLLGLGVFILTLDVLEKKSILWRDYLPVGIFAGLLLGVKYTTLAILPILLLAIWIFSRSHHREKFLALFSIGSMAAVLYAPWIIKNVLAAGNPLYPYFLPTEWVPSESFSFGARMSTEAVNLWEVFLLPLALTWKGVEGASGYSTDIGPIFVLLAVPGLLLHMRSSRGKVTWFWLCGGWVIMAAGSMYSGVLRETRHYLALLPAAGLAAGWGWEELRNRKVGQVRIGVILGFLVGFVIFTSLWMEIVSMNARNPVGVLTGRISRDEYLDQSLGMYPEAMRALGNLPNTSEVLFLWEPRSLYAPVTSSPDVWIDRWYVARRLYDDPEIIILDWKKRGFDYLLVNQAGVAFEREDRLEYLPEDWLILEKMLQDLDVVRQVGDMYTLYLLPR